MKDMKDYLVEVETVNSEIRSVLIGGGYIAQKLAFILHNRGLSCAIISSPKDLDLSTSPEFIFLFIDEKADRCEHLKRIVNNIKLPSKPIIDIDYECGKFHEIMGNLLDKLDKEGYSLAPSFVFIDPFGFAGVPMDLIAKIMKNKKCEVLINFMYEEIVRWLSLEINWPHLDLFFGSDEWRKINKETKDPQEKVILFHNLYKQKLKEIADIRFIRSFLMINQFNKPDYFLFFGTNNPKGLEKMKEAMWKVDKSGSFKF